MHKASERVIFKVRKIGGKSLVQAIDICHLATYNDRALLQEAMNRHLQAVKWRGVNNETDLQKVGFLFYERG